MGLRTSRTAFWAEAGTTYQIAVDGFCGLVGDVQLSIAVQPPPEVATPPAGQAVLPGEAARFTVAANSSLTLSLQWQVSTDGGLTWADVSDGALYSGATTDTLSVLVPTAAMGGYQYRCAISDAVSPAIASAPATLTVRWSRFAALSARGPVGTGEQTLILGFAFASGGKPTLVRGVGPGLFMSVRGYLRDPQLRLFASDGAEVSRNDDWAGTPALAEAFARTGAGPLATTSKDAALVEWDKQTEEINALFPKIRPEQWQEHDKAFGMYEGPTYDLLMYAVDNEIHHRGQAYVYFRALGIEPPPFYDRS